MKRTNDGVWFSQIVANILGTAATYLFFIFAVNKLPTNQISNLILFQAIVSVPVAIFDLVTIQQFTQTKIFRRFGKAVAFNELSWRQVTRERFVVLLTPLSVSILLILGMNWQETLIHSTFILVQFLWVSSSSVAALGSSRTFVKSQGLFLFCNLAAGLGIFFVPSLQIYSMALVLLIFTRFLPWLALSFSLRRRIRLPLKRSTLRDFFSVMKTHTFSATLVLHLFNSIFSQIDILLSSRLGANGTASYAVAQKPMLGLSVLAVSVSQLKTKSIFSGKLRITNAEINFHLALLIFSPLLGLAGYLTISAITPKELIPDWEVFIYLSLAYAIGAVASTTGPLILVKTGVKNLLYSSALQLISTPVTFVILGADEIKDLALSVLIGKSLSVCFQIGNLRANRRND